MSTNDHPAGVSNDAPIPFKPDVADGQSPANQPAQAMPTQTVRKPALGERVHVVTAVQSHVPATVIRVRGDRLVDLELEYRGGVMQIHSSPMDETGTRPDSFHFPEN